LETLQADGMKLVVLKETAPHESRVATTPDIVKKYVSGGFSVTLEKDAGLAAGYTDDAYKKAGAVIAANADAAIPDIDALLSVQAPEESLLAKLPPGTVVISQFNPYRHKEVFAQLNARKLTGFSLELAPRTTRAQSIDVLSSQANLAGYRAVIEAADHYPRVFPMFMTAAGTVAPARVFVMGAGVAGLQAIATARRLGAIVSATDVRMAAKEQVQSLGATFIMVEDEETKAAETAGGYAREMSDAYKAKQAALVADHITKQDIVICTALIPGKPAPVLVKPELLQTMKQGSVLVDLAAAQGGNCPATVPDQVVQKDGVTLIGYTNLASRVAADASALYAKNVQNFLNLIIDPKGPILELNWQDDILRATALTFEGHTVNPNFGGTPVIPVEISA
jgi:NAD(P) transhydrogenase subunit alpha